MIHDDDTLTFTDVYSARSFYQLFSELPQMYICNWLCLPIMLKHMKFKLNNAYVLIIIVMQSIYVILTLTFDCEHQTIKILAVYCCLFSC